MFRTYETSISLLRRKHRLLWLLLGTGCSLFLCSQLVQEGYLALGLLIGLTITYYCTGQVAARLVARSVCQPSICRPSLALFLSSVKIGLLFSAISILFHLGLLVLLKSKALFELSRRSGEPILIRAAVFPLLACLGAAQAALGEVEMPELPSEAVGHRRRSDIRPPDTPRDIAA